MARGRGGLAAGLRGLTARGRGFVLAGALLAVAGVLGGQRDLVRVAVLVLALPALAVGLVAASRFRLACARSVHPRRVAVGEAATVTVVVENLARRGTGVLLVGDALPDALGGPPRFVVDRLEPHGRREVSYRVRSAERGRFRLGPLAVGLVDPFGLCRVTRSFSGTDLLVVTPAVVALPDEPVGGDWAGRGDSRTHALAAAGDDDVIPRAYRTGDELRRVHWRASARAGALMVRREEQPWRSRATLLVDTRAQAHAGRGPDSSFEWALSAAASIGVHLVRRGWAVRVVDAAGHPLLPDSPGGPGDVEGLLLDALAGVATDRRERLELAEPAVRTGLTEGLTVAVLGACSPGEAEALARATARTGTGTAVVVDVAGWGGRAAPDAAVRAAAALHGRGWRTAVAVRGAPVASVWAHLAAAGGHRGGTPAGRAGVGTPGGPAGGPAARGGGG